MCTQCGFDKSRRDIDNCESTSGLAIMDDDAFQLILSWVCAGQVLPFHSSLFRASLLAAEITTQQMTTPIVFVADCLCSRHLGMWRFGALRKVGKSCT